MHYPVPPQPLLSSRGVSGRHKAGGWRERQTRAPQVLTTKGMDCEITPGLDNLPPHWNPWGTEIINLLISYTSLFPFFLEKKKKKKAIANGPHIRFLCQSLGDQQCFGRSTLSTCMEMGAPKLGLLLFLPNPSHQARGRGAAGSTWRQTLSGEAEFSSSHSTELVHLR